MSMMELVIAVGLFAIISVFLVELFMKAVSLQNKANELSKASIMCESSIECIKSGNADKFTESEPGYNVQDDGKITVLFTKNWEQLKTADSSGDAYYTFSLDEDKDDATGITNYTATVTDKRGETIYSLTGSTYNGDLGGL